MKKKFLALAMLSLSLAACDTPTAPEPRASYTPPDATQNITAYCDLAHSTEGKSEQMRKLEGRLNDRAGYIGIPTSIVTAHRAYFAEFEGKTTIQRAQDFETIIIVCRESGWSTPNERKPKSS